MIPPFGKEALFTAAIMLFINGKLNGQYFVFLFWIETLKSWINYLDGTKDISDFDLFIFFCSCVRISMLIYRF